MTAPIDGHLDGQIVINAADPRLRVMISSTVVDLPDHRDAVREAIQRAGQTPEMMELSSAEWNSDAVKYSLQKVDASQVYVGIFALRYGYIPPDSSTNPGRLSITEMEYRRAVERGIPTLTFIADAEHSFTKEQIDFEPEKHDKLERLKEELQKGICASFKGPEDLKTLVLQSLNELEVNLSTGHQPGVSPTKRRLPTPPDLYAVPDYILTNTFIGRASELDDLDAWAKSEQPIMVVEGIGGLGKSALTWEWMQKRATYAIPNLAGRVWWSFYERGTSMARFVRYTLAYVTGRDPDILAKDSSHYQRCQDLLVELRQKPFLIVLDGFERLLTAYHRWDKAQQRDDQIDPKLRECTEPRDGDFVQQLLHAGRSKVLVSTRLFPHALEDRASCRPIPSVAHHALDGLSRSDTLEFFRHAGIQGNEQAMLEFAEQFDRHSLLIKVICGEIAKYPRRPFHFDEWHADPAYGGKLKLSELDLKQRYNHILRFALEGLDEPKRKLLCRIAVLSENMTYDTLAVLNPYLRPQSDLGEEPEDPEGSLRWNGLKDEERQARKENYQKAHDAWRADQEARRRYLKSPEYLKAIRAFDRALEELEDRGLLQHDRLSGHYDMHPVVRGHAAELLEDNDRKQTFLSVRDHFAALPPDDLDSASELCHVAHSVDIYRCLVGAGLFDEAVDFYRGALSRTMLSRIGANSLVVEILKPLFRSGPDGLPDLASSDDQAYVLNALAVALHRLGCLEQSLTLMAKALHLYLSDENWVASATTLRNQAITLSELGRRSESSAAVGLAHDLAEAAEDTDGISQAIFFKAADSIAEGQLSNARRLLEDFEGRERPFDFPHAGLDYWRCCLKQVGGTLSEAECRQAYESAVQHVDPFYQYRCLRLLCVLFLAQHQFAVALNAIDEAIKVANRIGVPDPKLHDMRAWILVELGREDVARAELGKGESGYFAAQAWRRLGDDEQTRRCALTAYRVAWGEGPPYIDWYGLEHARSLLKDLGEPEPQLPPFDPSKIKPLPFEEEIRAAIARLNAEKADAEDEEQPLPDE